MSPRMEHDSDVVRSPLAWRVRPGDAARHAAQLGARGKHCEGRRGTRRCQDPIAIVTWRWWRSAEAGRVLVTERFVCEEHGRQFAARHGIEVEPAPERGTGGLRAVAPADEGGAL